MSNFDFLKNFNKELYEIGMKLEVDVIESPRAVPADATLFLETLVENIYKLSNLRLDKKLISFYKKIDNLYRSGVISYIYKNKLQDAYSLRNKIHKNFKDEDDEEKLAFDIHQRLYYISKKYFKDFCDNERFTNIPDYEKPENFEIRFKNCIICGNENYKSSSNMCGMCNEKIENANLLLNIQNNFENNKFTREDILNLGISESESISLLKDMSKENVIIKKGNFYIFNETKLKQYFEEIDEYIKIASMITKFYKNEITADEIKNTLEYWKGSVKQKPFEEFYKLTNRKIELDFEDNLLKFQNIKKSMKNSQIDDLIIKEWYNKEKNEFLKGSLNDAFILYNEILIKKFFKFKRKGLDDDKILKELNISYDIYFFWKEEFMGEKFFKQSLSIKKDIIIREIRKKNTLFYALQKAGLSKSDFDQMLAISQSNNDKFYKDFEREYVQKRKKTLLKHLKKNNLNMAIKLTKITQKEFYNWYYSSEEELTDFYLKSTEILMDKYLECRKNGWNKQHIISHINISKGMFQSWSNHKNLDLFKDFEEKNKKITSNLLKRGLVINNLKEGKSKHDAILDAGFSDKEFLDIYNSSKKDKTNFHLRFDYEYIQNRKRLFSKLIKENDFFNTVEKCEISQTDFNKWYLIEQDNFISNEVESEFYMTTTTELMNKYLNARYDGKNKPDSARSVGLSNIIINKWINHPEYKLYNDFSQKINKLNRDLIIKGFKQNKSKEEVSEIYDIPQNIIERYIGLGESGLKKYAEIYDLYENKIIPNQLQIFFNDFKTKTFNKSLKHSKLSKKELNYYYKLGKAGNEKFSEFYIQLRDLKIQLYVDNIIAKKSQKIALKNSYFDKKEFIENKLEIEDKIFKRRVAIIGDEISKHKTNGAKVSKKVGISIDEFYDWYFKGKSGVKKFSEVYFMIEIGIVFPRVVAYKKSLEMGIPKNWLYKKFKKDLGSKDFKIWEKHDILNKTDLNSIVVSDEKYKKYINKLANNHSFIKITGKQKKIFENEILKNHVSTETFMEDGSLKVKRVVVGK